MCRPSSLYVLDLGSAELSPRKTQAILRAVHQLMQRRICDDGRVKSEKVCLAI